MKNSVEYVKRNMVTMNTGGGCYVEAIISEEKDRALLLNDDGYSVIFIENYNKFLEEIEEKREEITKEYGKFIDIEDMEDICWLIMDIVSEYFEFKTIKQDLYREFDIFMDKEDSYYFDLRPNQRREIVSELLNKKIFY